MRSSFGVRLRVWFRIHDSGTRQRAANSAESISSAASFLAVRDIFGTSAVSGVIVSVTYHRVAVTLTAVHSQSPSQIIKPPRFLWSGRLPDVLKYEKNELRNLSFVSYSELLSCTTNGLPNLCRSPACLAPREALSDSVSGPTSWTNSPARPWKASDASGAGHSRVAGCRCATAPL